MGITPVPGDTGEERLVEVGGLSAAHRRDLRGSGCGAISWDARAPPRRRCRQEARMMLRRGVLALHLS